MLTDMNSCRMVLSMTSTAISIDSEAGQSKRKTCHRVVRGGYFRPNANLVRAAIDARGLTREQVAVMSQLSHATISKMTSGKTVSKVTARIVARVLRVRPEQIELREESSAIGAA